MTSRSPLSRLLAVGLATVLALAACGGGSDDDDDGGGAPITTTTADGAGPTDAAAATDPISRAIAAHAEELGVEDTRVDGDEVVLVMADGTPQEDAIEACSLASQIYPDGTISLELDGEVSPCA